MALLFIEGFEGYVSTSDLINSGSTNVCRYSTVLAPTNMSLSSTVYRTTQTTAANSRSLYITCSIGTDPYVIISTPSSTELILGLGFRFNATNTSMYTFVIIAGSSPTGSQGIVLAYKASTGELGVYTNSSGNPGTLLGMASGTYATAVWYYLEVRVKVGTTTGEVQLRINGVDVLNLSAVNTATGSLTSYTSILLTPQFNSMNVYVDDLYVCDTTGAINNTFLGPLSVYSLMPTSNGSSTQLTPTGAPSNWEAVDEVANDTTTYVETSSTGDKDYYNFQTLPAGVTTIHGVRIKALSTTVDNGGRKVKLNMKNGASLISSTLRALTLGSWLWEVFLSETAPDGSSWTKALVESTEGGVEAAE